MNRSQFGKGMQDGLNTLFGMSYDAHIEQYTDIFETHNSEKAFEEDLLMVGLGGAVVKGEGSAVTYDAGAEGWVARYSHTTISLAFAISEEAVEDGRYGDLGAKYSRALAKSMRYTKEVRGASVLNNAFDSGYLGGDGKVLCATDHPLWSGGTFANRPTTHADLSEESLEDACIAIGGFVDDRGIPVQIKEKKLIIHRSNQPTAHRILQSALRSGTGNNDANYLKDSGHLGAPAINQYLQDSDAWFITTTAPDGLKHFQRRKLRRGMEGDFETGNLRYKASERYSFSWTDPRGVYGSAGV
ncbi:MAG: hypothetical protein H0X11_08155 [Betaproteobacteria bacterium]|nr:hypothetical protein [Betaproteobacteria bacterium]